MRKIITYGSFDLFHEGHYKLLERAKALGDYLIVGVTTEQYDESRGKLNVNDSLMERIDSVRKTGFANEIIVEDHIGQKVEDIIKHKIDAFAVGSDWEGRFDYIREYCEVVYLERTKDISSTMLRAKNYNILKIGIIGTGRIASRFVPEAKYVSGINIEGVFNPHYDSAEKFAKRFDFGFATNDLADFFKKVDAVYIASPHGSHFEYIIAALNANKHVLCEKPMVLKKSEAQAVFSLAEYKGLVLMEGVKTAYCPGFSKLLGVARSGVIGSIKDVEACFTKLVPQNSREWEGLDSGAFLELASYPLFAIAKLLGTNYIDVQFNSFFDEKGVDYYSKAHFKYKNSLATLKVGIGVKSEGQMIISGTHGYILVNAPWWKTKSFDVRHENQDWNEPFYSKYQGEGLRYEINDFLSAVNGNSAVEQKLSAAESIFMAEVIERNMLFRITGGDM